MPNKVLIIRLGAIGDVVETTGLVRALKKQGFSVDYLTGKAPSTLLSNMKAIDNVFLFEKKLTKVIGWFLLCFDLAHLL